MEKIGNQEKVGRIVSTIKTMGNSGNNDRIILMRVFFTEEPNSGNNGRIYKVCMRLARLEQLSRYINILEMETIKVI